MSQSQFPISIIIRAVDKATAPIRNINDQVKKIAEPARRLNNSLRAITLEAGFGKFSHNIKNIGTALSRVSYEAMQLGKTLSAMGITASAALWAMVKTTANQGDHIAKAAQRLGIHTTRLQEWSYAAERAGADQQSFEKTLQTLGKNVAMAAAGVGKAKNALQALGIQTKDTHGHVKSLERLLPEIADKFSRIHNANVRNALAMQLMGEEGVKLVTMFKEGSRGINQLAAQAHRLGLILSTETIEASAAFNDSWSDLKTSLLAVKNILGAALLPLFNDWMQQVTAWIIEHRTQITAWIKAWVDQLPQALQTAKNAFLSLKQAISPLVFALSAVIPLLGGIKGIAVLLATLLAGKLLLAVLNLANAFKVLTLVIITNPILAVITGLIIGTLLLIQYWDKVKTVIENIVESLKIDIQKSVEWIQHTIVTVFTSIKHFLNQLNPFEAIRKGIEKTRELLSKLKLNHSNSPMLTSPNNWNQSSLGASSLIQRIYEKRFTVQQQKAAIKVTFDNAPKGTRIKTTQTPDIDLDTSMGIQMSN